ncbi:MAG: MBL fold metallo-hydrolase [Arachnia sp.]
MTTIEKVLTAGNPDPAGPAVHENNTWLIGDDAEVVVIDPAHDAAAVEAAVRGRRVVAVLITHGHWDHIRQAAAFAAPHGLVPRMNPADQFLWQDELGDAPVDALADGDRVSVAGVDLVARHTPGHTPGSTSIVADALGAVFTGDTLFPGGPGATRWDYSSFPAILESIAQRLFTLPPSTVVHPGHGASTTIGAESPHLAEWAARGW